MLCTAALPDFIKRVWSVQPQGPGKLMMSYVSADGEEGYPGTLTPNVTYTLTDQNELRSVMRATANQPTIPNPTTIPFLTWPERETVISWAINWS